MDQTGRRLCQGLEALIQCPICYKKLNDPVYMCGSGHSICSICMKESTICIQCQAPYTKIQNLLAQSLLSQFDNIKKCLIQLDDSGKHSKPIVHKTDNNKLSESKDELTVGQYRCWITKECKFIGTFSPILKHFKYSHPLEFEEHLKESLPYSNSWTMNYIIGNNFNRALNIGGLLFIVHISINDDEELSAYVLMYTGHSLAFRHLCRIEIECESEKLSYKKGKVLSAQSSEDIILQLKRNTLHITRNKPLYNALKRNKQFKCSIMIEKRNEAGNDGKQRIAHSNNEKQTIQYPHKQSIVPSNSAVKSEVETKIVHKTAEMTMKKVSKPCGSWHQMKQESQVHHQLYPNLGAYGFPSGQQMNNFMPPLPMMNNHFNTVNLPSAPELYERPPALNPYYQQPTTTSTSNNDPGTTKEKKIDDKCVVC